MKNYTNFLVPLALSILIVAGTPSTLGFLVIVLTSFGYRDWLPVLYYWQFDLPLISVILPIVGMIIIAVILLAISISGYQAAKPAEVEGIEKAIGKGEEGDNRLKTA